MNLLHALILGLVEGFTEFLPISSTAHLALTGKLLGLDQSEYLKSFEIIIQLGAILAVVFLYWQSLLKWEVINRLLLAFLPTGILGLLFYKLVKQYLLEDFNVMLWALLVGGLLLIIFERTHREKSTETQELSSIPYKTCILLGLFQSVAMIPGVSRSAATIVGGLLLGLQKKTIVEFSFLLAVPTMLAATTLDLYKNAQSFTSDQIALLSVGFFTSFLMALVSIKFLLATLRKQTFSAFGFYRIGIACLFFVLLYLGF
ncbi:undecaprenyl-diphosphate phosphatase [Candidatus Peregrinibacteria bacterium]|nr:MAG: undecaprenyl-diphosphate phosphatase [Candidatus Peregrinibacteria bacterium]